MREQYKKLYKDAIIHLNIILRDKIHIEQGLKEKSCFIPIINIIELDLLIRILKSYITQLERVIDIMGDNEGGE